jgi:hypothetical protein
MSFLPFGIYTRGYFFGSIENNGKSVKMFSMEFVLGKNEENCKTNKLSLEIRMDVRRKKNHSLKSNGLNSSL